MKIGSIRLDRMRLPLDPPFNAAWDPVPRRHFDATLVTVHTDEGVTGYGSGDTMDGFERYEPLFTGRDPLAIADHVRTIESIGFHAGRYWPLEAALWDIIGQVTGQPVSVLFGGATRRLPAYASFGAARSPHDRAQAALAAKSAGFTAVKIRIDRTDPGISLQAVRATRAAVGEEFVIMADLNQWWRMAGDASPALDRTSVRRIAAVRGRVGQQRDQVQVLTERAGPAVGQQQRQRIRALSGHVHQVDQLPVHERFPVGQPVQPGLEGGGVE